VSLLGSLAAEAVRAGGPGLSRDAFISGSSGADRCPFAAATRPSISQVNDGNVTHYEFLGETKMMSTGPQGEWGADGAEGRRARNPPGQEG
jgi:hypothetical protein